MSSNSVERQIVDFILESLGTRRNMSLVEVVDQTARKFGIKRHLVASCLYNLYKEERVHLDPPSPSRSFIRYLVSGKSMWFWFLISMIPVTALSVYYLPRGDPYIYLRYIVGAIFVIFLPGFGLVEALYPRGEDLSVLARFALSIGLSLALIPFVALFLNFSPWGVRLQPLYLSIAFLNLLFSTAALLRKYSYHKLVYYRDIEAAKSGVHI